MVARYVTVENGIITEDLLVTENNDTLEQQIGLSAQKLNGGKMSEYSGHQINFKLGDVLVNVTGATVEEALENLEKMKAGLDAIGETAVLAKQVQMTKNLSGGYSAPASQTAPAQNAAPAAGATAGELRCKHGAYKDLLGKRNAKGELYKNRYACPAPYMPGGNPDQCKNLPGQESNR